MYVQVTVALVDLSPEFHYSSVPRLSPHSFLQAKAKNTSPYTILAGPANIFLDNNFIAKVRHTYIRTYRLLMVMCSQCHQQTLHIR